MIQAIERKPLTPADFKRIRAQTDDLDTCEDVHAALGKPMFSKLLIELQGTGYEALDIPA